MPLPRRVSHQQTGKAAFSGLPVEAGRRDHFRANFHRAISLAARKVLQRSIMLAA